MAKMSEREFLIRFGVDAYNRQFNKQIDPLACDIKSIDTRVNFNISYEIFTNRLDDYLRVRMHLIFDSSSGLGNYRVETDGTQDIGGLGDEVFVATGRMDRYYKEAGIYKFNPILPDNALLPVIMDENYDPLMDEEVQGEYINNETA